MTTIEQGYKNKSREKLFRVVNEANTRLLEPIVDMGVGAAVKVFKRAAKHDYGGRRDGLRFVACVATLVDVYELRKVPRTVAVRRVENGLLSEAVARGELTREEVKAARSFIETCDVALTSEEILQEKRVVFYQAEKLMKPK
jgi:hypothetical protein